MRSKAKGFLQLKAPDHLLRTHSERKPWTTTLKSLVVKNVGLSRNKVQGTDSVRKMMEEVEGDVEDRCVCHRKSYVGSTRKCWICEIRDRNPEVWSHNLYSEFHLIHKSLSRFPCVSMDTEFPGTVFKPAAAYSSLSPEEKYALMKLNVDALDIIQLGLTLSDADGHLPGFGTDSQYVWQFNFRDFDPFNGLRNSESVSLLERQGIDFWKNWTMGIDSYSFSLLFKVSGLAAPGQRSWVTFHGQYEFGFLIKILHRGECGLPGDLGGFMRLVELYFGWWVYDVKIMAGCAGIRGGLERVAGELKVDRVGRSHLAGSDSLLTMRAFPGLMNRFGEEGMELFDYKLYGLTCF